MFRSLPLLDFIRKEKAGHGKPSVLTSLNNMEALEL